MAMSAKARALMTGETQNEWNKYQKSMQKAHNEWTAEQSRLQRAQKKRSGWSAIIGVAAFIGAMVVTGGTAAITGYKGLIDLGVGLSTLAGTAAGTAASAVHHKNAATDKETFWGSDLRVAEGTEVYDPKFGKGRADTEQSALEGEYSLAEGDIEGYLDDWHTSLFQNIGRGSSYMGTSYSG